MNNYPTVRFKVPSIKDILPEVNYFLNNKRNWGIEILYRHPELKEKLGKIENEVKRKEIIEKYFKDFLFSHRKELKKDAEVFQKDWDKINKKFMLTLSDVLEIKWPKKDKVIRAFVSPNPLCPKDIKQRTYDIYYDFPVDMMKSTSFHEILHFLYFEKWKQVFPKTKEREFDGPGLVWQLSEMVPKAILSDNRIQNIFSHKPPVYSEYLAIKINKRPLLKYIGEFYYKRKDFGDFLKKSYSFVKKHERKIGKI